MDNERQKMILENMGLAYTVAQKYYKNVQHYYEYEDAVQVCIEGLIRATDAFDTSRGVKFSTFAYNCIKNFLFQEPINQTKKKGGKIVVSLDAALTDDDNYTLLSITSHWIGEDSNQLDNNIIKNEQIDLLNQFVNELKEPHKTIMKLKLQNYTFEKIAKHIGKSPALMQRYYQQGLNMLRYKFMRRQNYNDKFGF